jgi:P4 family phage/plasmid primase-like protien
MLKSALEYHSLGFCVVPLKPREKTPLIKWARYQSRKPTEKEIRQWWKKWPQANIGLPTGKINGIVVFDSDGPEAEKFIARKGGLEPGPQSVTSKGRHYFFRHPGRIIHNDTNRKLAIDIRADGGYIVAPPSVHPSGHVYSWAPGLSLFEIEIPKMCSWQIDYLMENCLVDSIGESKPPGWERLALQGVPEGERNDMAARLAGRYIAKGLIDEEIFHLLLAWNKRNRPPLPRDEILAILKSVRAKDNRKSKENGADWHSFSSPVPSHSSQTARFGSVRPMHNDLGTLDVGTYLSHYGVPYKTNQRGATTLYALEHCVFDPDHEPWGAAVCYTPTPPFLTYQCSHDSCYGKTWREARRLISGDDSLAPFCANYDPEYKHKKQTFDLGTMIMRGLRVETGDLAPMNADIVVFGKVLPTAKEVDPMEFFDKRGKRPVFVEHWMGKYLATVLGPICHTDGVYWRYQDGVWREFPQGAIKQVAETALKDHVKASYIDASMKVLSAMVNRTEAQWVTNSNFINCKNGMVDLVEAKLLPHDPEYRSRSQIPANFDMDATYDRWLQFLEEVFPEYAGKKLGEPGKADVLQQYFGYCLLGHCEFQKALFLYGVGANGKSTAINALVSVLGIENASTLTIEDLGQRFTSHFLQGKMINIATETNTRNPLDTELFKAAIRGDAIKAERKYGEPYTFKPIAKWIVAMNETPIIPDKTPGFTRSILVLEFKRRFVGKEIDPQLSEKLAQERDGIFMWSLFGLERLIKQNGFETPVQVEEERKDFMRALNPFLIFIEEECIEGPGQEVSSAYLYNRYKDWCTEGHNRPLSRNKFYDQVLMNLPAVRKGRVGDDDNKRGFIGLGLK